MWRWLGAARRFPPFDAGHASLGLHVLKCKAQSEEVTLAADCRVFIHSQDIAKHAVNMMHTTFCVLVKCVKMLVRHYQRTK